MTELRHFDTSAQLVDVHWINAKNARDLACDTLTRNRSTGLNEVDRTRSDRRSPRELSNAQEPLGPERTQ